jgi:Asp-tRNA(Asn)/Glu-tRNA(Gln) amidotransferase A subunit family amidase
MGTTNTDTKPRWDFNAIGQMARKAILLADGHAVEIGSRLPPGFTKQLAADTDSLDVAVPVAMNNKDSQVQLTAAQGSALETGYKLVKAIRASVKGENPEKDVLLAYGVGIRINPRVVKDVKAAIKKILDRLAAQPADIKRFDFVQEDVDALKAAYAVIETADRDQEAGRAGGPAVTRGRNALANKILRAIKKIAGAGMRACAGDAAAYASFEALIVRKAS